MKKSELKQTIDTWLEKQRLDEKADNTLRQYRRSLDSFVTYMDGRDVDVIDKDVILNYKADLLAQKDRNLKDPKPGRTQIKSISTINIKLMTLNRFFKDNGEEGLKVKLLKDDTKNTDDEAITDQQYRRVLSWAYKLGNERIALIMETLAGTGIRVGELGAITVESLKPRTAKVTNKGKTRTIFIPKGLAKKLKAYCKKNDITSGIIFHGRDKSKTLTQSYINREIKAVVGKARGGLKRDNWHCHALRHLMARRYASMPGANLWVLPLLLGHSEKSKDVSVTVRYVKPTKKDLLAQVDQLEAYYAKDSASNGKSKK